MKNILLIATGNAGKVREIKAILSSLEVALKSANDLSLRLQVEETGGSYLQNAMIKANAYLHATGLTSLADDSGLEVDCLDGAPGLYSARFSPKAGATDADRRAFLLNTLRGQPQPWTADFHCTAVLALPDGNTFSTTGRCSGIIIPEERGGGGFGYDPIFYLPEYDATMAELPPHIKNQISHRARALQAMLPHLKVSLT